MTYGIILLIGDGYMHKLFYSQNNDYLKMMSSLSQKTLEKKGTEVAIYHDFATQYKEIEDFALTISLFNTNKLVIIEQCQFLTASQGLTDEALSVFMHLVEHKPVNMILLVHNDKLDERKKVTKFTKQHIETSHLPNDSKTAEKLFTAYLKQEKIIVPGQLQQQILLQANDNIFHAVSEIQRFILQYKTRDFQNITIPDVQRIPDEDIFFLGNFITQNNYQSLVRELKLWIELHPLQSDFQRVMRYLFNHAKLVYEVYHLSQKRYSQADIAKLLKVHEYRIKLLLPNVKNIHAPQLELFINAIVEGDYLMKTGVIDRLTYIETKMCTL